MKIAPATPDLLSNSALVTRIQESVAVLRNRGARNLAADTLCSELEDLHLEGLDSEALAARARALAQETGDLA